jgi:dUTP pyrophosphatase
VKDGDRMAQMVIAKHERVDWTLTDSLDATERGAGGYGSSGV